MEKNEKIKKTIAEIEQLSDYDGRLGFAVYDAVVTDEETCEHIGHALLCTAKQHPEHLDVIEETLIAITGWGFESLKREMEDNKDTYYSLIVSEEE